MQQRHRAAPRLGSLAASNPEEPIAPLDRLLAAWLARTDVPVVDPATMATEAHAPDGVRRAARFLTTLLDPSLEIADETLAAAHHEILRETAEPANARRLDHAAHVLRDAEDAAAVAEAVWSALCPDAAAQRTDWANAVGSLRQRRALRDVAAPEHPIPPDGILVTSNVLLTGPLGSAGDLPAAEAAAARTAAAEPQRAWYDHPIPLDMPRDRHEVVYGLGALSDAVAFDRDRGVLGGPVPVVLSLSSTHDALDPVAGGHLARTLAGLGLDGLVVHAFTEGSAVRVVREVLGPALDRLGRSHTPALEVFGVAGAYGRHYSFLKAIAAVWSVLVDRRIRATFKIDLDQVFPQPQLVAETGLSAFELLAAEGWGGTAIDAAGRDVSLDFIAGALVNEADAPLGIFTPDVVDPGLPTRAEHLVFFSGVPQAVSTEAEMMPGDGSPRQRVHVTGGTTGATVAGLRAHRPFTPSFWGRAEDQAYAISMWNRPGHPVALHVPGLVMRHDKATFAGDAIEAAAVGKLIGDHERIIMFSAYGRQVDPALSSIKDELGPFTGAFISTMPATVAYLRLAVTTLSWAGEGRTVAADQLFTEGVERLDAARRFVADGAFAARIAADRRGWDDVYDALDLLEDALATGEDWAVDARAAMQDTVARARVET